MLSPVTPKAKIYVFFPATPCHFQFFLSNICHSNKTAMKLHGAHTGMRISTEA